MDDNKREKRASQFSSVLGALYGESEEKRKDITTEVGKLLNAIEYLLERAKDVKEKLKQIEDCGVLLPEKLARLSLALDQLQKINDDPIETEKVVVTVTENLPEIFSTSIRDLGFKTRTENCLISDDIKTLKDLVLKKKEDLRKIHNLGKISLNEIEEYLQHRNLKLGMTIEDLQRYSLHQERS